MNKTLKKQAAPGCVNVDYITVHGRTVFAKDMASDLKQKLQQKRKNYKYAKTKTVHTMRGASLLCSCAGLVLQRKYGCIMLLIARQGERAYANEIF